MEFYNLSMGMILLAITGFFLFLLLNPAKSFDFGYGLFVLNSISEPGS